MEGRFVLYTVGGRALPQTSLAISNDTVFADTITVSWPDGSDGEGRIEHRTFGTRLDGLRATYSYTEIIRVEDNAIAFVRPPCGGPAVDCLYAERSGAVRGNTLTVTFTDPDFRPRVYVRF